MSGPLGHVTWVLLGFLNCLQTWRPPWLLAPRSYWIHNHAHVLLCWEPWKSSQPPAGNGCLNCHDSSLQLLGVNKHVCNSKVGKHQENSRRGHMVWAHLSGTTRCKRNNLINTAVQTSFNCCSKHPLSYPGGDNNGLWVGS